MLRPISCALQTSNAPPLPDFDPDIDGFYSDYRAARLAPAGFLEVAMGKDYDDLREADSFCGSRTGGFESQIFRCNCSKSD